MNLRVALIALTLFAFAAPCEASVTISTNATKNMSCGAGVCSPTAKQAVLNVNDLTNMLASGDVKITTGAGAVTITIAAPFSWTSNSRLTLDANYNVSFRAPVTVAGKGAVIITYNDGGSDGDLIFFPGAKLDFWNTRSSLLINGRPHTLVGDITTLASDVAANRGGGYAFTGDYDASRDGIYSNSPIDGEFFGIFEGLGHSIANLQIATSARYAGFFANNVGGTIRDVRLINESLQVSADTDAGGIAGQNYNGVIAHSSVTGAVAVSGTCCRVGGLVGINLGDGTHVGHIIHSSCACDVEAAEIDDVGGLIGLNNFYGSVLASSSVGTTVGKRFAGGLVGVNGGGISLSSSGGSVAGADGAWVGGLVGRNYGQIDQSFSLAVTGGGDHAKIGGLIGRDRLWETGYSLVTNVYARGSTQNSSDGVLGGLIGDIGHRGPRPVVQIAYSTGTVSGFSPHLVGGAVGRDRHRRNFANTYWDLDTSGVSDPSKGAGNIPNDPGIAGLTDAQLKSGLPAGFDPSIWGQNPKINNGYPYLLANPPPQ